MAVGGLPSKRQGRLGRPKGHHHPHAMAFFVFSASSHSSSSPSSFFTFFFFFIPLSSLAYSFSFSSLACSLSFSLAFSLSAFSFPAFSLSYSFSFLRLLPRLLPFLLLLLPNPLSLFCLQHLVRLHRLRLLGATPRDQARYPPTRTRPCHSGLPPGHVIGPIRSFSRPTLSGWDRSDGLRLTLRNLP